MRGKNKKERYWEIDTLRGIAILMMITYHILFDLNWFHIYTINLYSPQVLLFLYPIGGTFLFLVGVSLTLSYAHAQSTMTKHELRLKFLLRGLKVFLLGILITVVTWLYLPRGYIIFGVLHCIGISIILAYPLLRYKILNLVLGIEIILIGLLLSTQAVGFPWLLWLGLKPTPFFTVDYFPLLPWFGVVLLGVAFGNTWYQNGIRQFQLPDLSQKYSVQCMSFLGRHALIIYLIHQPIIIGLLLLFF